MKARRVITLPTEEGESPLILYADYPLCRWENINGKQVVLWTCPAYRAWKNMFSRVYDMVEARPKYADVRICKDWFRFSNFAKWFNENYIPGWVLDKDILNPQAMLYSPETCAYVPEYVNTHLSCSTRTKRASYIGVHVRKSDSRISAKCSNKHLGYFKTELEAHFAWQKAKITGIHQIKEYYEGENGSREDVALSLKKHADFLEYHLENGFVFDGIYKI